MGKACRTYETGSQLPTKWDNHHHSSSSRPYRLAFSWRRHGTQATNRWTSSRRRSSTPSLTQLAPTKPYWTTSRSTAASRIGAKPSHSTEAFFGPPASNRWWWKGGVHVYLFFAGEIAHSESLRRDRSKDHDGEIARKNHDFYCHPELIYKA